MDLLQTEVVLQQIAKPSEVSTLQAEFLLNFVKGEFEDEDGDWATAFIQADPIPYAFVSTSSIASSGVPEAKEDPQFFCRLCSGSVSLDLIFTELSCSCLLCKPCLSSYTHYLLTTASTCTPNDTLGSDDSLSLKKGENTMPTSNGTSYIERIEDANSIRARVAFPCPSPSCTGTFSLADAQHLAPKAFQQWQEAANLALFESTTDYVKCPGCNVVIEKVASELPPGLALSGVPELDRTVPFTELDCNRRPLSRAALLHKAVNRFRCTICHVNFCGSCLECPYHLGRTCEQLLEEKNSARCKYCQDPVYARKREASDDSAKSVKELQIWLEKEAVDISWCVEKSELVAVQRLAASICGEEECRKKLKEACTRTLVCGHPCGGVRGELNCLPCLQDACRKRDVHCRARFLPAASDLCTICAVESLHCAPSIQLQCGHIVHYHCAKMKVAGGWPGLEISFSYLNCPQCSELMKHTYLDVCMQHPLSIKKLVKDKALKRLKTDSSLKNSKELMPGGTFEGRPAEYAVHIYQYFLCFKCGEPYFGGARNCGIQADQRMDANQLMCGSCSAGVKHFCKNGHGKEYLEFKCQFCCSPAMYICYGGVNFCENCHLIRPDLQEHFLPFQCKGPNWCPLRIVHAPNGQKHCLGCSMCRLQGQ
ncbi:hypothetical protein O6H91_13G085400 [Diphasiastrum complanatum]|uniref:Uncharacterized protein n=1 Tax=Diphasiastrum complanatum TaxID=34168 RepID=A0ACC2BXV4_DIPCM|nr:hypothetical protein O6H91_13G085400 [Diphasiastrum complanatum]